jgi:hypothetical protein
MYDFSHITKFNNRNIYEEKVIAPLLELAARAHQHFPCPIKGYHLIGGRGKQFLFLFEGCNV